MARITDTRPVVIERYRVTRLTGAGALFAEDFDQGGEAQARAEYEEEAAGLQPGQGVSLERVTYVVLSQTYREA